MNTDDRKELDSYLDAVFDKADESKEMMRQMLTVSYQKGLERGMLIATKEAS